MDISTNQFNSDKYFVLFIKHSREGNPDTAREYLNIALQLNPELPLKIEDLITHWSSKDYQGRYVLNAQTSIAVLKKELPEVAINSKSILGKLFIAQAFNASHNGRRRQVLINVIKGIIHKPNEIFNRGVQSIIARAILPFSMFSKSNLIDPHMEIRIPEGVIRGIEEKTNKRITKISDLSINPSPSEKSYLLTSDENEEMIFRRQLRRSKIDFETRLKITQLSEVLPIPLPRIIASGFFESKEESSFYWLVEEKLPGEWLELVNVDKEARKAVLKELGAILRRLQKIPVKGYGKFVETSFVGSFSSYSEWLQSKRNRYLTAMYSDAISEILMEKICVSYDYLVNHFNCEPVLCHGDLHPGNIIVYQGVIQGLIDWEQVMAGDPAYDFAYFLMGCLEMFPKFDDELLSELLVGYEEETDECFVERIRSHQVLIMADLLIWAFEEEYQNSSTNKEEVMEVKENMLKFVQTIDDIHLHC
jgi:thiamine kinase-like enzyme